MNHTLARLSNAIDVINRSDNVKAVGDWLQLLEKIESDVLPSGSGFDNGSTIDLDKSTAQKIVINTSYHHMNEGGFYDGWTDHKVTILPTFSGYDIKVSGRDRNDIKEYIADAFCSAIDAEFSGSVADYL